MDTMKMISEIKSTCASLEHRKAELTAKIKEVDDKLTAYRMAIDSLELTVADENSAPAPEKKRREPVVDGGISKYTMIERNGKRQSLEDWAKESGLTYAGVYYRLRHGWSMEDALSTGKQPGKTIRKKQPVPSKVFAYDAHDNVIRQYAGVFAASRDLKIPENVLKSTIANVSKADQLRNRGYYVAYVK